MTDNEVVTHSEDKCTCDYAKLNDATNSKWNVEPK